MICFENGKESPIHIRSGITIDHLESGWILAIGMDNPRKSEIRHYTEAGSKLHIGYADVNGIRVYIIIAEDEPICDAPFNPRTARSRLSDMPKDGQVFNLHIVMTDARTDIVVGQRMVSLPMDLSMAMYDNLLSDGLAWKDYKVKLERVYKLYSSEALARKAKIYKVI